MSERNLDRLVSGAVDEVLETMFFAMSMGPAEPETGPGVLEAHLSFCGKPSGTLDVCLSEASARLLAAGFLGEDEERLSASQPGEVVCELANMLCGSLVSKLESDESFTLSSPQLVPAGSQTSVALESSSVARRSFEMENGVLTVTLHLENAA